VVWGLFAIIIKHPFQLVGISTGYRETILVRFPAGQDISVLHSVQTDFKAHQASYPIGTRDPFLGSKTVGV
jgi:hypothetical protein